MKCQSFLLLVLMLMLDARAEQPSAQSTIVLYNKADPDSVELAKFYAEQRGVAADHLAGLNCSTEEEISREEYDTTIAGPLREIFKQRHWWMLSESTDRPPVITASEIHFVAVIKGMPLKIRSTTDHPGDQPQPGPTGKRNNASVDSELALLGLYSPQISGFVSNPYFQSFRAINDFGNPALLLVCRLDAPDVAMVRNMIIDAIVTEKKALWGRAYVDGGHRDGGARDLGDQWLSEIPGQLHKVGVPVIYDESPEIFPPGYPMTDCALYYGWYAEKMAGPFTRPDFHFVRGAIAVHIHSYSANTLRDANANWVAPLISKGAAANLGYVYEPFLQLTSRLDTFNGRLLHGFTFAESAYMSIPALSWMSVMVGDPLYRPYAKWLQIEPKSEAAKNTSNEWKMYHEFAMKNILRPVSEFRTLARQVASTSRNCPMMEDLALMEARDGHLAEAASQLGKARQCYPKRDDILRVTLEEADAWTKQNNSKRALDLIGNALQSAPDAPAAPLLRKMEQDLTAPPASPTPKR